MTEDWRVHLKGFGDIRISSKLITELVGYRQLTQGQPESGGALIGKHLNSNGAILIEEITPPQPSDKQARTYYYRSHEHNKIVHDRWLESNGHSTLLGLWHTHPELSPRYSWVDKQDWLKALDQCNYEGDKLFFIIVGQQKICCWVGVKYRFKKRIYMLGEYIIEN